MEYLIREYNHTRDRDELIQIWLAALPDDFLSQLGAEFIVETYIPELLASSDSHGYVAMESNEIKGFVFACNSVGLLKRVVTQNLYKFIKAWVLAFRNAPFLLMALTISVAVYVIRSAISPNAVDEVMELCYIAIHPNCQSMGVGKALVERLDNELRTRTNAKGLVVKTLQGKGVGRSGSFYEVNGFKIKRICGTRVIYIKEIEKQ